jgi:hypothetical protein
MGWCDNRHPLELHTASSLIAIAELQGGRTTTPRAESMVRRLRGHPNAFSQNQQSKFSAKLSVFCERPVMLPLGDSLIGWTSWHRVALGINNQLIVGHADRLTGSLTHLQRLLNSWRRAHFAAAIGVPVPAAAAAPSEPATPIVPPIVAAALCIKPRGLLTEAQAEKVDKLKAQSSQFAMMRQLAMRFRGIFRGSDTEPLDRWLSDAAPLASMECDNSLLPCGRTLLRSAMPFASRGAAGQTEGQINRLKMLKRAMYGRAGVELLRARMLPFHACSDHTDQIGVSNGEHPLGDICRIAERPKRQNEFACHSHLSVSSRTAPMVYASCRISNDQMVWSRASPARLCALLRLGRSRRTCRVHAGCSRAPPA